MAYCVLMTEAASKRHAKERLEESVNQFIELGWKPQGGFSLVYDEQEEDLPWCTSQAMVK